MPCHCVALFTLKRIMKSFWSNKPERKTNVNFQIITGYGYQIKDSLTQPRAKEKQTSTSQFIGWNFVLVSWIYLFMFLEMIEMSGVFMMTTVISSYDFSEGSRPVCVLGIIWSDCFKQPWEPWVSMATELNLSISFSFLFFCFFVFNLGRYTSHHVFCHVIMHEVKTSVQHNTGCLNTKITLTIPFPALCLCPVIRESVIRHHVRRWTTLMMPYAEQLLMVNPPALNGKAWPMQGFNCALTSEKLAKKTGNK